jgi:hypothetical protein
LGVPITISVASAPASNVVNALRATLYFYINININLKPFSSLYLSKPRSVEQIMSDINENDTANRFLTAAEAFELFKRLQIEERNQKDEVLHGSELPLEISEYLDSTPIYALKEEFKRFKRQVARYNNENWNRQEQINKELIPELKRWKIDTYQVANNIYKYSENTTVQARASTEIYEQL